MLAARFLILLALLLLALLLNLCLGEVTLTPQEAWQALACPNDGSGASRIIWQIRLPRLIIAALVGLSLAVSGYVLQTLSRNRLADPYLTGVSSGAGLAVAAAIISGVDFSFVGMAAFAGGLLASLIVASVSRGPSGLSITRLLLAGVALTAICSGLITLLIVNSPNMARAQSVFFWLAGGIGGSGWRELPVTAAYTLAGVACVLFLSKPLRLLSLGAQPAAALGLDVTKCQVALLVSAVFMCGASVAVAGLVGFVGLIAPHLARTAFGADERLHIAASALFGAALVLMSDLAARTLGGGQELPLSTLLSLLGGPFFLWLVTRVKGEGL